MDNGLGIRIEEILKKERYKVNEFMEFLGISKTAYYAWKAGEYYPNAEVLIKILDKFPQYSAEWLLLGTGEMQKVGGARYTANEPSSVYETKGLKKVDLKNLFLKMIDEIDNI